MGNNIYISDELLAAYLDGNTSEAETLKVLNALKSDPELQETLGIALQMEGDEVLPMIKMAAESGENICSVQCEAFILHRRGVPFDDNELIDLAKKNNWLKTDGTPLHAIGQLLVHHDLMITHQYDATIEDIERALSHDNDVIVVVDSDKLYPDRDDKENAPNHAVVVTAISAEDQSVTIYDPQDNSQFSILISQFERAWAESQNYMIRVLQSIEDYEPQPINLEEIKLTDELLELREAIAENAHDVWATARKKEGWTFGPERDDAKKKHPDLIPYSALPDSEKEYDRIMALDTIRLVKKLGFEIVKTNKLN